MPMFPSISLKSLSNFVRKGAFSILCSKGHAHFLEMSGGDLNPTELVAYLVDQKDNLVEGIRYAQESIDGSMTLLIKDVGYP